MRTDWLKLAETVDLSVREFVDGRWLSECSNGGIEKYSPRDGRFLYRLNTGDFGNVHEAVEAARRSFDDRRWSGTSVQHRKEVLHRLADLLERQRQEFALLECLDVGKPITDAWSVDVPAAVADLRFYAEAIDKVYGKVYAVDRTNLSYQLRRPVGVVAAIVGWNFPLFLAIQKIGPALAAGNSLVLKPSELTSFSAARVAALAIEAGVPEGVFSVVHGSSEIGAALARHPAIDLITFTGSTATGKKLLQAAGQSNMKRLILECGGKAPNIVFADSPDLNVVADDVVLRAFRNQGEVCSAASRLLVHREVERELLARIVDKASAWRPGDPLEPDTRFGALVSQAHRSKVLGYIETGKREGSELVYQCDGPPPHNAGFYVGPTIFAKVSPAQQIAQDEIFGPVLSVMSFDTEEEAIRIANNTIYGLTATLWTKDMGCAHRVSQAMNAGLIVVNATPVPKGGPGVGVLPVGGHKQSGLGVEGGLQGLEAYTTETAVQFFV